MELCNIRHNVLLYYNLCNLISMVKSLQKGWARYIESYLSLLLRDNAENVESPVGEILLNNLT